MSKKVPISKDKNTEFRKRLFFKTTLPSAEINMSAIIEGQTASNSIDVDNLPTRPVLSDSFEWRSAKRGTELLAIKCPAISLKAGVKVISEAPKSQRGNQVFQLEDVPKFDKIRAREILNSATEKAHNSSGSSRMAKVS